MKKRVRHWERLWKELEIQELLGIRGRIQVNCRRNKKADTKQNAVRLRTLRKSHVTTEEEFWMGRRHQWVQGAIRAQSNLQTSPADRQISGCRQTPMTQKNSKECTF